MRCVSVKFVFGLAALAAAPVLAQGAAPGVPVSVPNRMQPPTTKAWTVTIGFAPIAAPAWQGSKTTAFSIFPDLRVNYRDVVFASIPDGLGWNAVNQDGWKLGPLVKFRFAREQDTGGSPFLISGKSDALLGLGNVGAAGEAGGFAQVHIWDRKLRARAELRYGFGGYDGAIADTLLSYSGRYKFIGYSFGARATFAGPGFTNAYFGVDPVQSANSGLPVYKAGGGVVSYGLNAGAVVPVSRHSALSFFTGYDWLGGAVVNSSLVQQRGQQGQFAIGMGYGYRFGWD